MLTRVAQIITAMQCDLVYKIYRLYVESAYIAVLPAELVSTEADLESGLIVCP